jgi:uncharacterized protein
MPPWPPRAKASGQLVAIGNGTASRETDKLVQDVMKLTRNARLTKIVVSEAGASVYSASELAAKEFPDLDVSIRGAVSIARRLQDPLAELVKIDPEIDRRRPVPARRFANQAGAFARCGGRGLRECGRRRREYRLGTAAGPHFRPEHRLAQNIVGYRDAHGAFRSRDDPEGVPRLGDKTFEQAAGFLRVPNGDNPLDVRPCTRKPTRWSSASRRPEEGDARRHRRQPADQKPGRQIHRRTLRPADRARHPAELEKPGRDPRPEFKTATFRRRRRKVKRPANPA